MDAAEKHNRSELKLQTNCAQKIQRANDYIPGNALIKSNQTSTIRVCEHASTNIHQADTVEEMIAASNECANKFNAFVEDIY
jgi:hypothetical protein